MKTPQIIWRIDGIGALVLAALTVVFAAGPVWMLVHQRSQAADRRAQLEVALSEKTRLTTELAGLRGRTADVLAELDDGAIVLESADNVNRRLGELSALATECGLEVNEIKPSPASPGTHSETVPIRLTGTGTYQQCAVFLFRLRQVLPDTSARSFEMSSNTVGTSGDATFQCLLWWHAAPQT